MNVSGSERKCWKIDCGLTLRDQVNTVYRDTGTFLEARELLEKMTPRKESASWKETKKKERRRADIQAYPEIHLKLSSIITVQRIISSL